MDTTPAPRSTNGSPSAPAREERREIVVTSPGDLHPLPPVPMATPAEVAATVERARQAQASWRHRSVDERIAALKAAAKDLLARRAEGAALAREEMGKVEVEGIFNETLGPLDAVAGWASVVAEAAAPRTVRLNPISFPKKRARVEQVPRGVIGVIAPWNFPIAGLYRAVLPALMSGNAVVVKPSEYTPRTSAWFLERVAAALPIGLVQVVQGDGRVGEALVDAGIDACVFTGSPATGRRVRLRCAERGIPSSIEMGGKDAALVLADCDLPRTVAGITHWTLSNAGQACGAIEVAYVCEPIADAFLGRLRTAWRGLKVGPMPLADVGPMGNRRQLDIVTAQIADAKAKGAQVLCGGSTMGAGLTFEPTLLDRCTPEMAVVRDETFGPVLAVVRVSGAEEAVHQINQARYGLGASIWTTDLARAERLASRLDVGVVTVNNHSFTGAIPALPWSGTRETGFGVANGREALATFLRPRAVVVDASGGYELYWMPYDREVGELGDVLCDLQLGILARAWKVPLLLRSRLRTLRDYFA